MKKPNKGANFSFGRSLDRKTLIQISIPITGAIAMATLMTYRHAISKLETQTVAQLEKYIVPRVQRESTLAHLGNYFLAFFRLYIGTYFGCCFSTQTP